MSSDAHPPDKQTVGRAIEERLMSDDRIRRSLAVAVALFVGAFPIYFLWALAIRRDFTVEAVTVLVILAVVYLVMLGSFIGFFTSTPGHRWWYAPLFLVPFVGIPVLVKSVLELAAEWRPAADRAAERDRRLVGLDAFHREVFRLRFDTVEGRFSSRRQTARELDATTDDVAEAERRILAHLEEHPE